jgi:hypothetical protein
MEGYFMSVPLNRIVQKTIAGKLPEAARAAMRLVYGTCRAMCKPYAFNNHFGNTQNPCRPFVGRGFAES